MQELEGEVKLVGPVAVLNRSHPPSETTSNLHLQRESPLEMEKDQQLKLKNVRVDVINRHDVLLNVIFCVVKVYTIKRH